MPIADAIREAQSKSSWIRKMFDEGAILKRKYGADKVFDFSLGNPDIEPPAAFHTALVRLTSRIARVHGQRRIPPSALSARPESIRRSSCGNRRG